MDLLSDTLYNFHELQKGDHKSHCPEQSQCSHKDTVTPLPSGAPPSTALLTATGEATHASREVVFPAPEFEIKLQSL